MNAKIEKAHANIHGVEVAKMIMEFQREFLDVYPERLMVSEMMAVGPMQSFIGHAISLGLLAAPQPPTEGSEQ